MFVNQKKAIVNYGLNCHGFANSQNKNLTFKQLIKSTRNENITKNDSYFNVKINEWGKQKLVTFNELALLFEKLKSKSMKTVSNNKTKNQRL